VFKSSSMIYRIMVTCGPGDIPAGEVFDKDTS
jgi:hypothetical protein